jgi:hypothetical protein
VIEFAAEEFGIDTRDGWRTAIRTGRADWRHKQTATVARDCPQEAAQALTEMGYQVTAPLVNPSRGLSG